MGMCKGVVLLLGGCAAFLTPLFNIRDKLGIKSVAKILKIISYSIVISFIVFSSIKPEAVDPTRFLPLQIRYLNLEDPLKHLSDEFDFCCKKSSNISSDKIKIEFDLDVKNLKKLYEEQKEELNDFAELEGKLSKFEFLAKCWKKAKLKIDIISMYLDGEQKTLTDKQLSKFKFDVLSNIYKDSNWLLPTDKNRYVSDTIFKFFPGSKIIKLMEKVIRLESVFYHLFTTFYNVITTELETDEMLFNLYKEFKNILYSTDEQKVYNFLLKLEDKKSEVDSQVKKTILDTFQTQLIKNKKAKLKSKQTNIESNTGSTPKITFEFKGLDDEFVVQVVKKFVLSISPWGIAKGITFASWEKLLSTFCFA